MAAAVTTRELADQFGKVTRESVPSDILELGIDMCTTFGCTAEDLVDKWEVYCMNRGNDISLTLKDFEAFQKTQQTVMDKKMRRAVRTSKLDKDTYNMMAANSANDMLATYGEVGGPRVAQSTPSKRINAKRVMVDSTDLVTPTKTRAGPNGSRITAASPSMFSPSSKPSPSMGAVYDERTNSGHVELVLNEKIPGVSGRMDTNQLENENRVVVKPLEANSRPSSRFMHVTPTKVAESLQQRQTTLTSALSQTHSLQETSPFETFGGDKIVIAGRVCCEAEGRLNSDSVMIEGPLHPDNGVRKKLDLRNLPSYALFPGQIVAAEGQFQGRSRFVPQRILTAAPPPEQRSSPQSLFEFNSSSSHLDNAPMTIVVASGPYTLSEDLTFKPLNDLLDHIADTVPDVLVMTGPFLDDQHAKLKTEAGNIDFAYEDLFDRIMETIEKRLSSSGVKVVLVPSLRDVQHDYIFPQPPFDLAEQGANVTTVGNPSTFCLNEVTVGVVSTDVLFHLGGEEVAMKGPGINTDRLGRLASHMIQQRSFYPLFPPPAGAQLDLQNLPTFDMVVKPDILIVPSQLKYFAKDVDGVLCINPGYVTKGQTAGTYASITVHPLKLSQKDIDAGVPLPHKVLERSRTEIVRI